MRTMGIVMSAALALGAGCKKEEAEAPKPKVEAPKPKVDDKPKVEAPKTLTGEERAKWYVDCWAAWGKDEAKFGACYDENVEVTSGDGRTMKGRDAHMAG